MEDNLRPVESAVRTLGRYDVIDAQSRVSAHVDVLPSWNNSYRSVGRGEAIASVYVIAEPTTW